MRRAGWGVIACTALLVATGCSSESPAAGQQGSAGPSGEPSGTMILATTTSTQDSGLLDVLVPSFEDSSDCVAKTVAVGSGEAMEMGARGDADVLLVHSPADERQFMAQGSGLSRKPVMHNDFVIVGPADDPAGVAGADDAAEAMQRIAAKEAPFASRADDSGTNTKELELWDEAGVAPSGSWYLETGQGMGETLTIADQKGAYTLSDRATFLATNGLQSEIAFEGSDDLLNIYHVIVVDNEGLNTGCAKEFSDFLRDRPVQQTIGSFGVKEYGEQLFHPDALR